MKSIQVVKENKEQEIFRIREYSFVIEETEVPFVPIYRIIINQHFDSPLAVRYWIEDISNHFVFLSETPSELRDYIKKYEENRRFSDICLFHDMRTTYIDFIHFNKKGLKNNILLVGYTLLDNELCVAIKAFSLTGLTGFVQEILNYCQEKEIYVEKEENLRWVQLGQCMLPKTDFHRNYMFDSFLKKTLDPDYSCVFLNAFNTIDSKGYLDRSFYDRTITIGGHSTTIGAVNQFTRYFSAFWKTDIKVDKGSKTILYLHDELLNDESINKVVYTLKPNMMQYYQLHWFEDFTEQVIANMNISEIKIINSYIGREFNFYRNGRDGDKREIDLILGIQYNNDYRIVAIECKKTLTDDEISKTNKKIRDKILKAHTDIIDAYIHIGCFNNGVLFDKSIKGTHEKYKQGKIQVPDDSKVNDVPYFAFAISDIDNFRFKMCYVVKEIFEQW